MPSEIMNVWKSYMRTAEWKNKDPFDRITESAVEDTAQESFYLWYWWNTVKAIGLEVQ